MKPRCLTLPLAIVISCLGPIALAQSKAPPRLGANFESNADYTWQHQTADVPLRPWAQVGTPWNPAPGLLTNANGDLMSDAGTVTMAPNYPDGPYTLTFSSPQPITEAPGGMFSLVSTSRAGNVTTQIISIHHDNGNIKAGAGELNFTGASRDNPVTHLHFTQPELPAGSFTPDFIRRVRPFTTGWRTMNWIGGNNQVITSPDTLPDINNNFGYSYDHTILLANQLKPITVWVNIPYNAEDATIKVIVDKLRDKLDPKIVVRIELSNEVWNFIFKQAGDNVVAARANAQLTRTDDFGRAGEQYGYRIMKLSQLVKTEFGPAAPTRTKIIVGGQCGNNYFHDCALDSITRLSGKDARNLVDEIAIAPYVGDDIKGGADQLVTAGLASVKDGGDWYKKIQMAATDAQSRGLKLVGYEGGEGWRTQNPEEIGAAADKDPRTYDLYKTMFAQWESLNPGGLWMLFSHEGTGWGMLNDPLDHGSQKWDATMDTLLPKGDCNLDGKVDYADFLILKSNFGKSANMWWEDGDFNHDGKVDQADMKLMAPNLVGISPEQADDISKTTGVSVPANVGR